MSKFKPQDRNYLEWRIEPPLDKLKNFDPVQAKALVGDEIDADELGYMLVNSSPYRTIQSIPGILVYSGRTYGRDKDKMIYKCIPNDRQLPMFIISYKEKGTTFNKIKMNKFVLFKFLDWDGKHPRGCITNTLGDVTDTSVFYSYQLFCKKIHNPIQKFTKTVSRAIRKPNKKYDDLFENREDMYVITIDPEGTADFDDALGITELSNGSTVVSVYIANVVYWMDALDLWEHFTERITTIYLPNGKHPMLPNILGDGLCSLNVRNKRYALAMDITINKDSQLESVEFNLCSINVKVNYEYEEPVLLLDDVYQRLLSLSKSLNKGAKYIDKIEDSHDVVAFYMLVMNHKSAQELNKKNKGIFRSVVCKDKNTIEAPDEIRQFVSYWKNVSGTYTNSTHQQGHALVGGGLDCYLQITSPIRRMVDLINMVELQSIISNYRPSAKTQEFINKWMGKIPFINEKMKAVQKVQNDCALLDRCIKMRKELDEVIVEGFVIDKERDKEKNKYTIHVPKLKLTNWIYVDNKLELYKKYKFSLHSFIDEATLKSKVRLQFHE